MAKGNNKSSYKKEYCKQLIEYFDVPPYKTVTKAVPTKNGPMVIDVDVPSDFRTLSGFARKLGVHRDTLHRWTQLNPEFKAVYDRAKDFQEDYLATNGLKGIINTSFAIFTAKNVLRWRDVQPGEADKVVTVKELKLEKLDLETRVTQIKSKK